MFSCRIKEIMDFPSTQVMVEFINKIVTNSQCIDLLICLKKMVPGVALKIPLINISWNMLSNDISTESKIDFLREIEVYVDHSLEYRLKDYKMCLDYSVYKYLISNYNFVNVSEDLANADLHLDELFDLIDIFKLSSDAIGRFIYNHRHKVKEIVGLFTSLKKQASHGTMLAIIRELHDMNGLSKMMIKSLVDTKIITRDNIKEYNCILLSSLRTKDSINLILELIDIGLDVFQVNEDNESILFDVTNDIVLRWYIVMGLDPHHVSNHKKNIGYYTFNSVLLQDYQINIYKNGDDIFKYTSVYKEYKSFIKKGLNMSNISYFLNCLVEIGSLNHPITRRGNTIVFYIDDEALIKALVIRGLDIDHKNSKNRTIVDHRKYHELKKKVLKDPYVILINIISSLGKPSAEKHDVNQCKEIIDMIKDLNVLVHTGRSSLPLFCVLIIHYRDEINEGNEFLIEIFKYLLSRPDLVLEFTEDNFKDNWQMYDDKDQTIGKLVHDTGRYRNSYLVESNQKHTRTDQRRVRLTRNIVGIVNGNLRAVSADTD